MKKLLMILLGAMLVLSMAGMVSAATTIEGDDEQKNAEARVILSLHELYTVTLPSEIILDYDSTHQAYAGKAQYSVDILRLDTDNQLSITVASTNGFKLVATNDEGEPITNDEDETITIDYSLGYGLSGQHIGGQPPASMISGTGGNLKFVDTKVDVGIGSEDSYMYLHAKVDVASTSSVDSNLDYNDILTFTVETYNPNDP